MSQGMSIHIGLNEVKSTHYGVRGSLRGCENDADLMYNLAISQGFEAVKLLSSTNNANYGDVRREILKAQSNLDDAGILLITYAGHGGQVKDLNYNEPDGYDETWCLFDEQMLDDELFELWTGFKKGQRIVVISDSCHSGTITESFSSKFTDADKANLFLKGFNFDNFDKAMFNLQTNTSIEFNSIIWERDKLTLEETDIDYVELLENQFRLIPTDTLEKVTTSEEYKGRYLEKQTETRRKLKEKNINNRDFRELIYSSVILLSACQDWQLASDGSVNGAFTNALKAVLDGGGLNLNYLELHEKVWIELENTLQNPNYSKIGIPNSRFETQACFKV